MPGLFGIYEMSRRSLMAYQAAISTVGNNVANAGVPGFHRQRVDLQGTASATDFYGNLGTGITVESVQRVESRFLEYGLLREQPVLASYGARAESLLLAENSFAEPGEGGLSSLLDDFYGGWDDLASNPEDGGVRDAVVRLGVTVADAIRSTRTRLDAQQQNLNGEIMAVTDDANRAIRQLAELNNNILYNENNGVIAADLEDRRDLLVSTIVELTGATATIEEGGTATVWLSEHAIVQRDQSRELTFGRSVDSRLGIDGNELSLEQAGGRIGGLQQARDEDIGGAIARLNAFTERFANDVNALHETGTDEHGQAAGAFFVIAGVNTSADPSLRIQVANDLIRDPSRVAAGRAAAPGENGVALDIAALRNDPLGASGMLQSLIVDMGSRSREAQDLYTGQRIVVDSFAAQKESLSGVNLDEEASQLLQFQRSYEAAARVLTIADEMTQTILQL